MATEKNYPKVGEKCYLRQFTGSYYVDMVKRPYTVIEVHNGGKIVKNGITILGWKKMKNSK